MNLCYPLMLTAAALPLCLASCNSGEEEKKKLQESVNAEEARAAKASEALQAAERRLSVISAGSGNAPVESEAAKKEMEKATAVNAGLEKEKKKLSELIGRWESASRP